MALASLGESRTCDSCRWLPGSQGRRAGRADGPAGKEGSSVTGQAVCLPTHCRRQTGQPVPRGPSPASWRYPLPRQLRGSLDTPGPRPQRSPAVALCPPATSGPQRTNLRSCERVRPDRGPETCLQHTCSPLAAPTAQRPGGLRPQPKEGSLFRMQGPPNAPSLRQRGAHTPPPEEQRDGAEGGSRAPTPGEFSAPRTRCWSPLLHPGPARRQSIHQRPPAQMGHWARRHSQDGSPARLGPAPGRRNPSWRAPLRGPSSDSAAASLTPSFD